jgi:soluble lytic murein transglycosylase-like protein
MARQGDLFANPDSSLSATASTAAGDIEALPLLRHQLEDWRHRLASFQHPLFAGHPTLGQQGLLFAAAGDATSQQAATLNPLELRPQPLSFWRWPAAPHQGAALYFVIDLASSGASPLLLYVGETGRADHRWKGEHDCKRYLAAYSEALQKVKLPLQLSIRFWLDVPEAIKPRRALEQALIQRWQPPFNKETRERWATPFTAELD